MRTHNTFVIGLWALAATACSAGIDPPANTTAQKIEGGTFTMGGGTFDPCETAEVTKTDFQLKCKDAVQSELFAHTAELKTFWLDEHEVTNFQYKHCVAVGDCDEPGATQAGEPGKPTHHKKYYDTDTYKDHPMIGVTAEMAAKYCAAAGGRLPTEAEWEFAATSRGTVSSDSLRDAVDSCDPKSGAFAFGKCSDNDILAVGTATQDVTEQNVHDMVGSVQEWVADTFDYLAYCAPSSLAAFEAGPNGKFPVYAKAETPAADVAGAPECLSAEDSMSADFPGKGCNQRLQDCLATCNSAWKQSIERDTLERQRDFAEKLCQARVGTRPDGSNCFAAKADDRCKDIDASTPEGEADKAQCETFCACAQANAAPEVAGEVGGGCLRACMADYGTCAQSGVTAGFEAARGACYDAPVGLACLDVDPGTGKDDISYRMRPVCLPRGTDAAPYAAYDGDKNVPHEPSDAGKIADHHTIRGANFGEADVCLARVTRRETYSNLAYSGLVGFRCAYDRDPATAP